MKGDCMEKASWDNIIICVIILIDIWDITMYFKKYYDFSNTLLVVEHVIMEKNVHAKFHSTNTLIHNTMYLWPLSLHKLKRCPRKKYHWEEIRIYNILIRKLQNKHYGLPQYFVFSTCLLQVLMNVTQCITWYTTYINIHYGRPILVR